MLLTGLILVELFTSQGCSSCPPADALLAELDKDPNVIVLSLHVDYWNHLGWRDPFSSSAFSERQQRYARNFNQDGPYTPQMVVDGKAQFVGSDRRRASAAIAQAARTPKFQINLVKDGSNVQITAPLLPADSKRKSAELWVALVSPEGAAEVPRGENAGRNLHHVAIVRSLVKAGAATHKQSAGYTLKLEAGPWRVVAFLQEPGQRAILAAERLVIH